MEVEEWEQVSPDKSLAEPDGDAHREEAKPGTRLLYPAICVPFCGYGCSSQATLSSILGSNKNRKDLGSVDSF